LVADERGELVVVSYEDKAVCVSQGSQTRWEGDLRRFIDDTVIEFPLIEDEAAINESFVGGLTDLSRDR
jgi:hypothetical protein